MSFWDVAFGLTQKVFRYLYADGRAKINTGLSALSDGIDMISTQISEWLYDNGYFEWSHRVRVLNRFVLNTIKVTAYVLSIWKTFEIVSRVAIDGIELDYIE